MHLRTREPNSWTWEEKINATPEDLAGHWKAGAQVSPHFKTKRVKDKRLYNFVSVDWLAVLIDLRYLSFDALRRFSFTRNYASVVAYQAGWSSPEKALIAFETPYVIEDVKLYRRLLLGLEAMYEGAQRQTREVPHFGAPALTSVEVLGGKLDQRAVTQLLEFGGEQVRIQSTGLVQRSLLTLEADEVVATLHGDELQLDQAVGIDVFCPFHADDRATALDCLLRTARDARCASGGQA